jgi:hypothetical protein
VSTKSGEDWTSVNNRRLDDIGRTRFERFNYELADLGSQMLVGFGVKTFGPKHCISELIDSMRTVCLESRAFFWRETEA